MKPGLLCVFIAATAVAPLLGASVNRPEHRQKPYVVLVSFDGLGAQLLDRAEAPNFSRVMRQGVRAESLIPAFPSATFPNHYTIATGLYPENHGIVQMEFFDPERGKSYSYLDQENVGDGTWYRGEPIWVTAEKQGMAAATCFWPGSEAEIQGVRPSHWKKYTDRLSNEERVQTVLEWLRQPEQTRPHLLTLYFGDVDGVGHRKGPESPEIQQALQRVDQSLGHLLDGIESLPVRDRVYLVLVSDHGMATVSKEQLESIDRLIDVQGLERRGAGNQMSFWVKEGPLRARQIRDGINAQIQHGRAYLREEIPRRLHHSADPRIGDVVILMEEPWRILPPRGGTRDMTVLGGWHGWDPASKAMRGIFLVMGPGIRQGATIPAFENIHIYPLLVELLSLTPARGIDGKPGFLSRQILNR